MTGTVAPGKQCVDALNNLMFLTIESPTIKVDGENRDEGCGFARMEDAPSKRTKKEEKEMTKRSLRD